jgi:hypothetical protein
MEIRNRHPRSSSPNSNVCSSNSPNPVRKLFAGNKHPYDELLYDYADGATQSEHRTALLVAMAAWIRNGSGLGHGSGAQSRLCELEIIHEYEKNDADVVQFAIDVATRVLTDAHYEPVSTAECVAAGFVTEERFVDPDEDEDEGVTIRDLWNWSPTEPLREAAPLGSTDTTESVLTQTISLDGPLWAWVGIAAVTAVVGYCWLVAMLVSGQRAPCR